MDYCIWQISPWPLSAIKYGLCTLLVSRGNTTYRCVSGGWAIKPSSDLSKEYIKLTTCSSVPDYSSLLFLCMNPTPPVHPSPHCIQSISATWWISWLCLLQLCPIHPVLGKNCSLHHFQMAEPWVICHEHWDQMQWEKGRETRLCSICSENRVQDRSWCYRLEIHFRQENQCRMGQMRSNNWMAPFQDDLFMPSLWINYGWLIRMLY